MKWYHLMTGLGAALLLVGHGLGLFWAPEEMMMREVGRILYAHVPTAWVAMVAYLVAFVAAVGVLWHGRRGWDATLEASVEIGVVLNALLTFQGSIWAKPTWGVYWTWDPRLTTTAIMVLGFAVVLLLRKIVTDPDRRVTTSAVATVIAFVDVPIVYFSVKWWNTLHQEFSTPESVDRPMVLALRISAFGMLVLVIGLIGARRRITLLRAAREDTAPDLPEKAERLELDGTPTGEG